MGRVEKIELYKKASFVIVVFAGFLTVSSVYWDSWWHTSIGRESMWIPPHVGIFLGLGVASIGFLIRFFNDLKGGERLPKGYIYFIIGIALIILSSPIDDLWHRKFGVEFVGSVLELWSPPHLLGLTSGLIACYGVLRTLIKEGNRLRGRLFTSLITVQFALLISIMTFILLPFEPTSGLNFLGIFGIPFIFFPFMLFRWVSFYLLRRIGVLTLTAMINWIHLGILVSVHLAVRVGLVLAAGVLPAFVVDIVVYLTGNSVYRREAMVILSLTYSLIFSVLFYPTANYFGNLGYSILDMSLIVVLGAVAAALAGYLSPVVTNAFVRRKIV